MINKLNIFCKHLLLVIIMIQISQSVYSSENVNTTLLRSKAVNGVEDYIFINKFEAAPILIMSSNFKLINAEESVIISWGIFNNATSCEKSGDWDGPLSGVDITNGVHTQQVDDITENSNFSLSCSNEFGASLAQSVSITVLAIDEICADQPAILNSAEDFTILANGTPDAGLYNGLLSNLNSDGITRPWPGMIGNSYGLSLDKNKYISAAFLVDGNGIDARIISQQPTITQGMEPSAFTVAISACPGDFNTHLNQSKCKTNAQTFYFSSKDNPQGPPGFYCELEQGQVYFLNIVHSDNFENDNYETSDCDADYCGIFTSFDIVTF